MELPENNVNCILLHASTPVHIFFREKSSTSKLFFSAKKQLNLLIGTCFKFKVVLSV